MSDVVGFGEAMTIGDRHGLTSVQACALWRHVQRSAREFDDAFAAVAEIANMSTADILRLIEQFDEPVKPPAPSTGPPKPRLDGRRRR